MIGWAASRSMLFLKFVETSLIDDITIYSQKKLKVLYLTTTIKIELT